MKEAITVREAISGEAVFLSDLAMRSKAHWGYSKAFMEACREELSVTPEQIEGEAGVYVIAEKEAETVGFYALSRLDEGAYELEALFVDPAHIGTGVGRLLMNDAKARARMLGARTLLIQSDPHAEAFYRAAGGVPVGRKASGSIPGRFLTTYRIVLAGDGEA